MGVIADLFGASKTASAQKKAADKAAAASQYATDQSIALQRANDDRTWAATQGARDLGNTATGSLNALFNGTTNATDWTRAQPNYQVNLDAGQRQINASAAAKGGLLSGAAAREGLKYGADYATNQYQGAVNNLFTAAGQGAQGVSTGAQTGQATANASQNALTGNAANLASSYNQKADATGGMWGTVAGTFGQEAMAKYAKMFAGFGK